MGRTRVAVVLPGVVAMLALAGCHHRRVQPVVLPPSSPVALIPVPEPDAPLLADQPSKLPAVPVAQAAEKPKKPKKRVAKPAPAPAAQQVATGTVSSAAAKKTPEVTASAPPPPTKPEVPVTGIGALTVGGEQSPRASQEASELLATNERRLNAMGPDVLKAQAELVGKVRNFQKEAQIALQSGDAEGAKTLATKGKLLLDDLDKSDVK